MTDSIDRLLDKIRKLRAKAEDPSTTEEEAASFATKVAELLAAHGLDEASLRLDQEPGIVEEHWDTKYTSSWRWAIISSAARLYFCRAHVRREGAVFVGRPHCAVVAREMAEYLIATTTRLGYRHSRVRREQLSFHAGCGYRLGVRLLELYRAQTAPVAQNQAGSGLPALYATEESLVDEYLRSLNLTPARQRSSRVIGSAYRAGAAAAEGVSLSAQITATPASRAAALPAPKKEN